MFLVVAALAGARVLHVFGVSLDAVFTYPEEGSR